MTSPADRLKSARLDAGYATAQDASTAFGWSYPTYAGHENGSRGMRPPAIERYARAFRIDPAWLQFGSGAAPRRSNAPRPEPAPQPSELSEPAAAPFVARTDTEERTLVQLAARLAPTAQHVALYVATRNMLDFAILVGDVLAIDLKPAETDNRMVIVNHADFERDTATTAIARAIGPHLVYPAGENRALPDLTTAEGAAILGTIVAVLRQT